MLSYLNVATIEGFWAWTETQWTKNTVEKRDGAGLKKDKMGQDIISGKTPTKG